mmetsp:Transcript_13425/g.21960  ORF Transcript_13425/g.21960 Transcript_13425/m.21960 type:complete len:115 (-) Transcript_13425:538-882(-)|eukprot:jgi/Bigna1/129326/aug1.8_g4034
MGTTFTSKRSPTGEVPVIFKTPNVDNKITIQFDIGLKTGKDLAMAWFCHVCRPGMGTPGAWKFKLIFNGKEIQNDDSETLLDKGFNASGGASEVILIPLDDEGNVDVPKQNTEK